MTRYKLLFFPALLSVFFLSCGTEVYSDNEISPVIDSSSKIEQTDELFTKSDTNENLYTFKTKNKSYLNSKGTTLWSVKKKHSEDETFSSRTVRVVKESGSANAGFGIVFCVQESEIKGVFNMLTVLLNTNGQYAVGKIIKGNYTNLQWWTDSKFINRGYGAINYIHIEYNPETTEFSLKLNGAEVFKFSDSGTSPRLCSGDDGYAVVIDGKENFTFSNTKVTFLEKED